MKQGRHLLWDVALGPKGPAYVEDEVIVTIVLSQDQVLGNGADGPKLPGSSGNSAPSVFRDIICTLLGCSARKWSLGEVSAG